MRPLSLMLPASLLALAATAQAQTLPYPQVHGGSIATVHVTPTARTWVRQEQARQIAGAYAMSNGWRLNVSTASRHIDATIDNQRPMRLLAVAPYKFASPDGNVIMEFNRGNWGDEMMMSYIPDPRLATIVVFSAPMAQR